MGLDRTGNWNESVQITNPLFFFFQKHMGNFSPTVRLQAGGISLAEMFVFLSASLFLGVDDRKRERASSPHYKGSPGRENPTMMSFENPSVGILKDSDKRCSSEDFEALNLIASFVSFTEGKLSI